MTMTFARRFDYDDGDKEDDDDDDDALSANEGNERR